MGLKYRESARPERERERERIKALNHKLGWIQHDLGRIQIWMTKKARNKKPCPTHHPKLTFASFLEEQKRHKNRESR